MYKKLLIITGIIFILLLGNNITLSSNINFKKTRKISNLNELIPKVTWNKTFGGSVLDWGWSVQETTEGGFIIAGETVSFGSGGFDAWLIKTDSNGNETWNKTFGGAYKDGGRSVQQTYDGGYIIGGYADSYGNPGHDTWLIKTDDDGIEEWNNTFGGLDSDGAFCVRQTSDEGYIAIGYADSYGAGDHDVWMIKIDKYGHEEWNCTYGTGKWDLGYSVRQTEDDGFIIIGTTKSYGSGNQDAWLIKTDMYGKEEWNRTYGGANNDWGSAVVITDDDGYLLTGDTRSYGPGGYDIWLIKTDFYGNETWRRIYGDSSSDDTGYSLIKTSDGGYVITGTKTSFATGLTDAWVIKTNINGYMQWNLTIDGGEDDWSYSVDETMDGGYIIIGKTNSSGSGNYDLWLIKVELINYENQPPTVPNISGPQFGNVGVIYEYIFVAEDLEDNEIFYYIDWGDDTYDDWFGPYPSGQEATATHAWNLEGDYEIIAKAKDINDNEGNWSDPFVVRIGNYPPDKPYIDGPTHGKAGEPYDYTFNATDPEGDDIWYLIGWGDKEIIYIYGPYHSGEEITLSYTWMAKGTYVISCWARDIYDAVSDVATLEVTMPRSRIFLNSFLLNILELFPNAFSILRYIFGV